MLASKLYAPTLRDDPAEADVASHKLMLKAGMLRKNAAGLYSFLPLGRKVCLKVENIIRKEMNRSGAQEVMMPIVQPAEIWRETGRWDVYGPEMFKLKDRHDNEYCLGPTHEELITTLVRNELRSYKQLPVNLWQMQNKYRDEIRPRFGLMRSREFVMKDAYSWLRVMNQCMTHTVVSLRNAVLSIVPFWPTRVKSAEITVMSSWPLPRRAKRM